MHLLVGSLPANDQRDFQPLLEGLGLRVAGEEAIQQWLAAANAANGHLAQEVARLFASSTVMPLDLNGSAHLLGKAMEQIESAQSLIFHARPETVLLRAMEEGSSLTEALHNWCDLAAQVLDLYRHNRRRVMLVSSEAARSNPAEFSRACSKHFGLQGTPDDASRPTLTSGPQEEIHRLIAAQMIAQSPTAQDLVVELEASSVPLGEPHGLPVVDCEQVYRQLREMTASKSGEEAELQLHDAREENELLLLHLHQVQEELESYYLDLRKEQEKEMALQETIAKRNETIKNKNVAIEKKEQKYQDMLAQKKKLDKQLETLRHSLSWRITRPVRAIRRVFKRKPTKSGVS